MKFGTVYFNHPAEKEYVGAKFTKQLGATMFQMDFAEVSTWYQVHKAENYFDWSQMDRSFEACEREGLEPIISLAQHFAPPERIRDGPFNQDLVETPQYGSKYGVQFNKMTKLEKEWADYVTELVRRYGDRAKTYSFSHEWNLIWSFCSKMGTPEYQLFLRNQVDSALLAYKIIKEQVPKATVIYGLFASHKRDKPNGRPITPLYQTVEDWPFGPSFMIRKFIDTGDKDFLELMRTSYLFYCSHTNNPTDATPLYLDTLAGDATEALYNAETLIDGKKYKYKDYISSFVVAPISTSGVWNFNREKIYSEKEQADQITGTVDNIMEAKKRGIPIDLTLIMLVDKNKFYSSHAYDQWLFVPEGIYRMAAKFDPLRRGPTNWAISYEPKEAVAALKQKIVKYT